MKEVCFDCKYYLPVDVYKGLCKISKEKLTPESKACDKYDQIAKCKFCNNYTASKEHLGFCKGSTVAYPEMLAITCHDYIKRSQN
jgi:4-hydroxyphenylacetate decarboxylase small subunit